MHYDAESVRGASPSFVHVLEDDDGAAERGAPQVVRSFAPLRSLYIASSTCIVKKTMKTMMQRE